MLELQPKIALRLLIIFLGALQGSAAWSQPKNWVSLGVVGAIGAVVWAFTSPAEAVGAAQTNTPSVQKYNCQNIFTFLNRGCT